MCGIVGVVALQKKTINAYGIKAMVDAIAHRGPDDAGYLFFQSGVKGKSKKTFFQNLTDNLFKSINPCLDSIELPDVQKMIHSRAYDIFMGHRRLSIVDISAAAHQPMSDATQNVWVSYNGEIYNFKNIKQQLIKKGYSFQSESDTEVILYAYLEWGIECINHFNGMFAFALYDKTRKKFFLVRDRYGIKPLYYHLSEDKTLLFGSEIKAILPYNEYQSALDTEALIEYFTFQNLFTNKTLHRNIHILEAGHYLEIDLASAQISKYQYWDFNFSEPLHVKDDREYIEELDRLFVQAVERQLMADVDVGSYLSGGMDSGSITAIAARSLPNIQTFTIGFDLRSASGMELAFDERTQSEYMSYKFKTEHYEMVLKSGDMERCLPSFAYHLEEPRVGQSYPNYYAAKLASKFVKVVLSGTGGDELFAGYPWRYYRLANNQNFDDYIDKYYTFWQRLIPNSIIKQVFSPISQDLSKVWTRDIFANVFKKPITGQTTEEYINHSLYFEAKTFLHGLLIVEDKLSMAHSLESRVPFLDNDLVDFAQKIPVKLKLGNLENIKHMNENEIGKLHKTNDGKLILRKAMSQYIPRDISQAIKQGFSSPDQSWFKGESIEFVKEKLLKKNALLYQYMDYEATKKLILEHLNGCNNRRLFIWSLLNFEEWCSIYGR